MNSEFLEKLYIKGFYEGVQTIRPLTEKEKEKYNNSLIIVNKEKKLYMKDVNESYKKMFDDDFKV